MEANKRKSSHMLMYWAGGQLLFASFSDTTDRKLCQVQVKVWFLQIRTWSVMKEIVDNSTCKKIRKLLWAFKLALFNIPFAFLVYQMIILLIDFVDGVSI